MSVPALSVMSVVPKIYNRLFHNLKRARKDHFIRHFRVYPYNMNEIEQKFALPKRFAGSQPSVWVEYIQLALDHKPLNLGQGFPDYPPPKYITDALVKVSSDRNIHQYTRSFGHPRLVKVLAKLYSKLIGREINPMTEVLTTVGGYEALYSAVTGHVEVGDEVIIVEPFFDCYEPQVRYAGGIPKFIALQPQNTDGCSLSSKDFVLDKDELESLFNEKTKIIILNTPSNPIGKVFSMEELCFIAELCKKHNVLCLSDEVYEWMVYKPNKHIRIATLPGMWERTITVGSVGKSFGVTGWKTGWAYGPANLMYNLQMIHQNSVYTGITPIQEAIAIAFETEIARLGTDECYFEKLPKELEKKKNFIAKALKDAGFIPIIPEGGFFMMADWSPLESKVDMNSEKDKYKDYRFTKWMTKNVGLQGIPPSAFYSAEHKCLGGNYVRYCFCKTDKLLQEVCQLLNKWKSGKK